MPTGIEDKYYKPSQGNYILLTFTIPHINDILQAKIYSQIKAERLKANFSFVMENKARCTVNFAKLFPLLALFFEQF